LSQEYNRNVLMRLKYLANKDILHHYWSGLLIYFQIWCLQYVLQLISGFNYSLYLI